MELFFDSSDRFFVFEDFHLAKPTDWYKLMNVGGDDLTQKRKQHFAFCFEDWLEGLWDVEKDCTWNLIWVQLTSFDKISQANFNFSNLTLLQDLRRASQTSALTKEALTRDSCTCHACHTLAEARSGKKHPRTALFETLNGNALCQPCQMLERLVGVAGKLNSAVHPHQHSWAFLGLQVLEVFIINYKFIFIVQEALWCSRSQSKQRQAACIWVTASLRHKYWNSDVTNTCLSLDGRTT